MAKAPAKKSSPKFGTALKAGESVFIRTVTHHYTGKVESVNKLSLTLSSAAWIADDGRFGQALATGSLNEVEPFPDGPVDIFLGSIVDVCRWSHPLPRSVK